MVRVGAHFFYVQEAQVPNGCAWVIGIVFGSVPGAASYLVTYWDGYYKQLESSTIYAAQLVPSTFPKKAKIWPTEPIAAGSHQLGVTGGTGSGDCGTGAGDPTEGGRFSKGAKAWAVFPPNYKPPECTLSGRVRASKCSETSCTLSPRAGVYRRCPRPRRRPDGHAGGDGRYTMKLKEGSYSVALSGIEGDPRAGPPSRSSTTDLRGRLHDVRRPAHALIGGGPPAAPSPCRGT